MFRESKEFTGMAVRYPAEQILIRCPNWIGDMVAATAAIRCVRRNYPHAHITLLLRPYVRAVIENAPWLDEIVEFDPVRGKLGEVLRVARRLRRKPRFDLALLLTHSFSSALTVWRGRVKRRVGHARNGRSWMLTDAVPRPRMGKNKHLVPKVQVYAELLEYLGCECTDIQRPELFTSEEDETRCDRLLKEHGRDEGKALLVIVPGAAFGSSKLWEPARFSTVADALTGKRNMQAAILTGPGEGPIGDEIARHMRNSPILFAEGEMSFGVLKATVRRSALMICNDTGPRHVAIAYNIPVVVLMGPTDPIVTASDYKKTIILRQDVPCGPCYRRTCPTDHRCMKLITPEMVTGAAEELFDRYGKRPEAG